MKSCAILTFIRQTLLHAHESPRKRLCSKTQLQEFLRNGQNISEINHLFAIVHGSDTQARRWYAPFKQNHKTLVQYTIYPDTRYVVRFSQCVFNITHHFTFYFYRHAYTHVDWISTFLQGERSLWFIYCGRCLYTQPYKYKQMRKRNRRYPLLYDVITAVWTCTC